MNLLVVNIVLAFYLGDNLASVIGNPIGQPMATVSAYLEDSNLIEVIVDCI